MCQPDPRFDSISQTDNGQLIHEIPVFQIFGTTPTGDHHCILVHGYFPAIYVSCPQPQNSQENSNLDFTEAENYSSAIISYASDVFGQQAIITHSFEEATAIYGYQTSQHFLRLLLSNPSQQAQISSYLASFVWCGTQTRVFQGHIAPFIKFFAEYNLTGFGYLRVNNCCKEAGKFSRYKEEYHCKISDIDVEPFNGNSQVLSHLKFIWSEQKDLRRRLGIGTQAPITMVARHDLIFTQRMPNISCSTQEPPKTQEFEDLLGELENFDPDISPEEIAADNARSQAEIEDIMNEGIAYQTPSDFVPGRVSQCIKISDSQLQPKTTINTFVSKLVSKGSVSVLKEDETAPIIECTESTETESEQKKEEEPKTVEIETGEHGSEFIKILFVEIGCSTRGKLLPNPEIDPVACVSFVLVMDKEVIQKTAFFIGQKVVCGQRVIPCTTELDLFSKVTSYILEIDPDIIIGYNIEKESIGYMKKRGKAIGIPQFYADISRTGRKVKVVDECKRIEGRILVNLWRVIRHSAALRTYTLANVSLHYLGIPFPNIQNSQLSLWLRSSPYRYVSFICKKVDCVVAISDRMNFIDNYCELTSILGCDFCSTYSRGSQFQIESLLSRVARRMGYLLNSPTKQDVAGQRCPMSVPLVMEPLSGFYSDPVLVIDFQSLYPSTIIAYNLDYSSIIGRTEDASIGGQVGCMNHRVDKSVLEDLISDGHVINTPNDVLFVTKDVRPGVLPAILSQILNLRAFIKQTIKKTKNKRLLSILDARQQALKLIAACSYGYTAANYSGRMPCVELADSVVECSRHVLEYCIQHIQNDYEELTVLYGDTDSLFIRLPPGSLNDCFDFADKLCDEITSFFPSPMKIKIEKIYKGCFLVNKKRYVGWAYESRDQKEPKLDIKGLENKRRDACLFTARVMTEVVESVFRTRQANEAEEIFRRNVINLCSGKIPIDELFFARELRLGTYRGIEPPGAFVARRKMAEDPMAEPLYGERLQYLVVSSVPSARLVDRVVSPEEYLYNNSRVCTRYYLEKQLIPQLGRVIETMGVDVNKWMHGLGYDLKKLSPYSFSGKNASIIEQFYVSSQCPLCHSLCSKKLPICPNCISIAGYEEVYMELRRRMKECEKEINKRFIECNECINEAGSTVAGCFCSGCHKFWELKLAEEWLSTFDSYEKAFKASCLHKK